MRLGDLVAGLDVRLGSAEAASLRICDVTEDSRTALPGSLFIARKGEKHDGRAHIAQAMGAGAVAALVEDDGSLFDAHGAAVALARDVTGVCAAVAERFYGNPSSRLLLMGVTGTNGKTTIAHLTHQILNGAGAPCGLIGTVSMDTGDGPTPSWMTTPSALETSRLLAMMVDAGLKAAAMEVSSHALQQKRADALEFDVGVFTNLTGDHQDYHGTMEAYAAAKARLFERLDESACAVVNLDDPAWERMVRECKARVIGCTLASGSREVSGGAKVVDVCRAAAPSTSIGGMIVSLAGPWGEFETRTSLVGRHNVMNMLQAAATAHAMGVSAAQIAAGLERATAPPGRLERVALRGGCDPGFAVFVDYAHTDDALVNVLTALRPMVPAGARLLVVFGCGGDRDATKRPRMGAAAARLADEVIITSDNPRTEDPEEITRQVAAGIPAEACSRVEIEVDRERAIGLAVARARPGDIVLIAGKGHEDYQILPDGRGGVIRRDFDDRIVARAALAQRFGVASDDEPRPRRARRPRRLERA